ncbi:hypothetical protein [uncultured Roseobacter sp.]|uniref:hypothetical protein n=1 Tax=uncultured Roseobacter sp. TaxID=114847 RepID=UPI00262A619B|nr:hypothetical protein [uncultured Roseobacter sp.]
MEQTLFVAIVVSDPLISQDVAGIFAFWQAGCVCRTFETVRQAREVPDETFDPALVFVAARGGVLDLDSEDLSWIEQRAVITLDLGDTSYFPHWQHLNRPFTQAQVIQAAHCLMSAGDVERVDAE